NPDVVVICSYPPDSVGMVKAVNEIGFKPKMIGGAMVGLQATALKMQLGPMLNGFVNYDFWLPVPKMQFTGVDELIKKYQAKAAAEGVDALGYYMAPFGYAQLQVLQQAIEATKSIEDKKLADYIRTNTFKTVAGDVKFGKDGEWAQSRVLQIQFHDVKSNDVEQFRAMNTQTVVAPDEYKSGNIIYTYEKPTNCKRSLLPRSLSRRSRLSRARQRRNRSTASIAAALSQSLSATASAAAMTPAREYLLDISASTFRAIHRSWSRTCRAPAACVPPI